MTIRETPPSRGTCAPLGKRVQLGLALLAFTLAGCAAAPSGNAADPGAKRRANAEKQEQLGEMLEKGQRN
jgi:hypothetical protein